MIFSIASVALERDLLKDLNRKLRDTNGGIVALYAELDKWAENLRRADELKTTFLSNVSHEFRTPVSSRNTPMIVATSARENGRREPCLAQAHSVVSETKLTKDVIARVLAGACATEAWHGA